MAIEAKNRFDFTPAFPDKVSLEGIEWMEKKAAEPILPVAIWNAFRNWLDRQLNEAITDSNGQKNDEIKNPTQEVISTREE
jgi:hypothetical protein